MACRTIAAGPGVTVIACTRDAPLCKAHAYPDPRGRRHEDGEAFDLCWVHHEMEKAR